MLILFGVSVLAMIASACLLQGHKFIYIAPSLLLATFAGLYFKPPKYYLPLCIGFFLGTGLYIACVNIIEFGFSLSAFISLLIGLVGFGLVLSGVWQFMFGEWRTPAWYDKAMNGIVIGGVILILGTSIIALTKDTSKAEISTASTAESSAN